jgi:hypothetical protein
MANTYTLLETVTVGAAGASSVTFSGIPQTHTDLVVKASARSTSSGVDNLQVQFNGNATGYVTRALQGDGSAAGSLVHGQTNIIIAGYVNGTASTASTFTNTEFYISNYTSANFKSISIDATQENNATTAYSFLNAGLWSNTAAITSINIGSPSNAWVANSTFYLYGIKNS